MYRPTGDRGRAAGSDATSAAPHTGNRLGVPLTAQSESRHLWPIPTPPPPNYPSLSWFWGHRIHQCTITFRRGRACMPKTESKN